ncbi:hypothetical protein AMTR_s00049p00104840 [Amborella trichopoda]|uniref:Uncharacterized protein n=2 Tax=Amborella trichopoda TaxID=13333 RepID=W1Q0S7_AMBTC|nr:hypothetical protein AMTR_s00049p00104840 [Amborella trichopoda]
MASSDDLQINTDSLTQPQEQQQRYEQEEPLLHESHSELDHALHGLEQFLGFLGFYQSPITNILFSWLVFLALGLAVPVITLKASQCSGCSQIQILKFEVFLLVSQSSLAAVSLICVSHNLRKYGIRKFIFVDRYHGQMLRFHKEYVTKIRGVFSLLIWLILPCLLVKTIHEVLRISSIPHVVWWKAAAILFGVVISWTYLTAIFLSSCVLFNLVCNLQVIHFEDYGKLLERDLDVLVFLKEHLRLCYQLSKISHRFRIYLLLALLVVTASQSWSLFQTTGYTRTVNFINAGDLAVSSVVQVVGIILCLQAATRISHRAQGISSVACKWHALVTCTSTDMTLPSGTDNAENLEADPAGLFLGSELGSELESDLESVNDITLPTPIQIATYLSSYHKRQALVMYLQSNPGGITLFGWTVDRALINTIFVIELTLVLWVLGKTIISTST